MTGVNIVQLESNERCQETTEQHSGDNSNPANSDNTLSDVPETQYKHGAQYHLLVMLNGLRHEIRKCSDQKVDEEERKDPSSLASNGRGQNCLKYLCF